MTTKCDKKITFEECELAILRSAVDKNEKLLKYKEVNKPEVKQMITIVEDFIRDKELICYGGTAINNILPKEHQFYNYDIEIPDYDFFSTNPVEDAKALADIYASNGFKEVEAKAGAHLLYYIALHHEFVTYVASSCESLRISGARSCACCSP